MAVLCDEKIRTNPFRISRDEGIRRFQPLPLIFDAQLERNLEVFVNRNHQKKGAEQIAEDYGRKMPPDFIYDKPRDSNPMGGKPLNENVEQMLGRRIADKAYGKKILVAVKNEQQAWLPRALPGFFGPQRSNLPADAASWAKNSHSDAVEPSEDIGALSFETLLLSSAITT